MKSGKPFRIQCINERNAKIDNFTRVHRRVVEEIIFYVFYDNHSIRTIVTLRTVQREWMAELANSLVQNDLSPVVVRRIVSPMECNWALLQGHWKLANPLAIPALCNRKKLEKFGVDMVSIPFEMRCCLRRQRLLTVQASKLRLSTYCSDVNPFARK